MGLGNTDYVAANPFSWSQVTHIKTIHQEDELIEIQSATGTWYQRWGVRALSLGGQVMRDGTAKREGSGRGGDKGRAGAFGGAWRVTERKALGRRRGGLGVPEVSAAAV